MTEREGTITVDKEKLTLFNGYTSLNLANQNLTNLELLEGQTELTSLDLSNNQITLADEASQNILKGMTKLKSLNLSSNSLQDISAINSLKNLTSLSISGTNNNVDLAQIEDVISNLTSFSVNESSFQTIGNCKPEKITKIIFSFHGYGGKLPENLSKLTHLQVLSLNQCGVSNLKVLSEVPSLKSLDLGVVFRSSEEKLSEIDFSKLVNLKTLNLANNGLWTEDIQCLGGLSNRKDIGISLQDNALIDPEILLTLDPSCSIGLKGNVNLSEQFKTRLKERFNNKVSF